MKGPNQGAAINDAMQLDIIGPEGVPLRFAAATVIERAFAFSIDLGLIIVMATLTLTLTFCSLATGTMEPMGLMLVGIFFLRYGYFPFFEIRWQGATPGKRLMGLKVISADGGALHTDAVIARNLVRDLEFFLPMMALFLPESVFGEMPWWLNLGATGWLLLMSFFPFLTRERTRVGDVVGGTRVVRVPRAALLPDAAENDPDPFTSSAFTFRPEQLRIYGEEELETLATLMRDHEGGHVPLHDLTLVAQTIARKIDYGAPLEPSAVPAFLRAFYRAQRDALEKHLLLGKRKRSKHDDRS